jgi:arabinofuranosyltransferase
MIILSMVMIGMGLFLSFRQDDAFILFRYAKNLVLGNGLVFNPGEWVEGFTCPLWVLILSGVEALGLHTPGIAGFLGLLFAVATIWVVFTTGVQMRDEGDSYWLPLVAPILLATNSAFASFTTSGLETALFTFLLAVTSFGLIIALKQNKFPIWLSVGYVLLTLTRPEGLLAFVVAWIAVTVKNVGEGKFLRNMLPSLAVYAVPLLIITGWRWMVYGYPLPNPAYAKVFLDQTSLRLGLNYAGQLLTDYGWFGLILIIAAIPVFAKHRNQYSYRVLGILFIVFSLYIIFIGGDVLKGLRFFVPLFPIYYLLIQEGIRIVRKQWFRNISSRWATSIIWVLVALIVLGQSARYPKEKARANLENGLITKMTILADWFKAHTPTNTNIAANSIGTLGYLTGYKIIDMVGLVDETIAHHPKPIAGIHSPAKERTYNADHVLAQHPDFIVFDTYEKPNHAGDFALYLNRNFRTGYYRYPIWIPGQEQELVVFKAKGAEINNVTGSEINPDFIYALRDGMDIVKQTPQQAEHYFRQSLQLSPPDFAQPDEWLGMIMLNRGKRGEAESYFRKAIKIDSFSVMAIRYLAKITYNNGATDEALQLSQRLISIDPNIPDGWLMTGWILKEQGKKDEAIQCWRDGIASIGNHPELLKLIASTQ